MHPLADSASPFGLAFGLPLHPLAVHVPVVLLPLGAIGVLLLLLVPRWRTTLAWPVIAVLGIATVGALVAKLSGEALAERVGDPGQHQQLGNWVLAMSAILCAGTLAWWFWQRRLARRRRPNGVVGLIVGTVLATLALGSIIVAVLTGHTGATAVWQDTVSPPTDPAATTGAPSPEATAADESAVAAGGIDIAEVGQHDDAAACWVAIEGTVYDLTEWIPLHPGGPDRILAICGTDATAEFDAQHDSDALPTEQLSQFSIGALADR